MDLNDIEPLKKIIREIITKQTHQSIRYKNIALSTKNHQGLDLLVRVMQNELNQFHFWIDDEVVEVPKKPSDRIQFNSMAFDNIHPGLVIVSPEDWMFDWPDLEKSSFWSALSEAYGRHIVITIFAENHEILNLVSNYFYVKELSRLPLKIWISKYQQDYSI